MQKICIVIPCYNEEKRLPVDQFGDFINKTGISICFVNDGSKDKTIKVLENLKIQHPDKIYVLDLEKNCGKAEAVRQGMLSMAENNSFSNIGYMDADLATPLNEVTNLLQVFADIPELKLVFGARVKLIGRNIQRTAKRHYFGRLFSTIASLILGLPVYDTQCGAKFFQADSVPALFQKPFISKWLFDIEIIARLRDIVGINKTENYCFEFPLTNWKEIGGSRLKPSDLFKVPFELYKIHRNYPIKK